MRRPGESAMAEVRTCRLIAMCEMMRRCMNVNFKSVGPATDPVENATVRALHEYQKGHSKPWGRDDAV